MGRAPPYAVGGRLSRGAPVGRDRRRRRSEFGGSSEYRRRGVDETPVMTANDELPPVPAAGRSINRRQALAGLGSLGIAALLAACGKDSKPDRAAASTTPTNTSADVVALLERSGSCSVVPELTEGPYYIDVDKVRSDIREDRPGTALTLAIRVRDSAGCTPRANAV